MSLPHKETMTVGMDRPYNASFHKMLRMFTLTLLTAFVGTYVGMQFVPPAFMLPLVVIELVMLVSAMFIRRRGRAIGYPFVFAFCFISGITLFPAINYYLALGGAAIINTASVTAYEGSPTLIDYSASKGAVVAFTRALAKNLAAQGIRVNAVAPGPIWTPLIPSTFAAEDTATFGTDTPMKRPGQPSELAAAYVFLASGDSTYMTGQTLHLNGGKIVNG